MGFKMASNQPVIVTSDPGMIIVVVIFGMLQNHTREHEYDTQEFYSKIINDTERLDDT
jgi:hypothetical protein